MTERIIPKLEDLLLFIYRANYMDFREIGDRNINSDLADYNLKAPRYLSGREVGYEFSSDGYKVIIWTTIIKGTMNLRPKGQDAGWVIITYFDNLIYCARTFFRGENFFLNLARYAWIAKRKITHRPICPNLECKEKMHIFHNWQTKNGSWTRQYFWICKNPSVHEDPTFLDWDYPIRNMKKAKAFVEIRRDKFLSYKKRNKKLGLNPKPKALVRRRWKKINKD